MIPDLPWQHRVRLANDYDDDLSRFFGIDGRPPGDPIQSLLDLPVFVLLGPPGSGKSHELRRLHRSLPAPRARLISLGDLDLRGVEEAFDEAAAAAAALPDGERLWLLIDSLDEGRLAVHSLAQALGRKLKQLQPEKVGVGFACRSLEWPGAILDPVLSERWQSQPQSYQASLLLLDWDAIRQAADAALGDKSKDFRDRAFADPAVRNLAELPVTLQMLLAVAREGALPEGRTDLYERAIDVLTSARGTRLVNERGHVPSSAMRAALLNALGALSVLTARPELHLDAGAPDASSLRVDSLVGVSLDGGDGRTLVVTTQDLAWLRYGGPFDDAPASTLTWTHRTIAEFLAARALDRTELSDDALLDVLTSFDDHDPDRRFVVPQLLHTASWLAARRPGILKVLVETSPFAMLRADIANLDDDAKCMVAGSVLRALNRGRADDVDEWGGALRDLKAPGLESVVRPYLVDPTRSLFARRVAIRIAEATRMDGVRDALWAMIVDPPQGNLRVVAARAWLRLTDGDRTSDAQALLERAKDLEFDPDDEVRGVALEALWDSARSVEGILPWLDAPREEGLFGTFRIFLEHIFPPDLDGSALVATLRWVSGRSDLHHGLDGFASAVLARAMDRTCDPDVANTLATWWATDYRFFHTGAGAGVDATRLSAEGRTALREALLEQVGDGRGYAVDWMARLGFQSECCALLNGLSTVDDSRRRAVAFALLRLADRADAAMVQRLLDASDSYPSFGEVWAATWQARGRDAEVIAREEAVALTRSQVRPPRRLLSPPPAERVRIRLAQIADGNITMVPDLFRQLALREGGEGSDPWRTPVWLLPGWELANVETRAQIIDATLWYVREHRLRDDRWISMSERPFAGVAAVLGLLLIAHERPQALSELSPEVWHTWAPGVALLFPGLPSEAAPAAQAVRQQAIAHASAEIAEAFHHGLSSAPDTHAEAMIDRMTETWGPEFVRRAAVLADDDSLSLSKRVAVHLAVARVAPDAQDRVCALVKAAHPDALDLGAALTVGLLGESRARVPTACWNAAWDQLIHDRELARQVLPRAAQGLTFLDQTEGDVDARRIAAIYRLLEDLYPESGDLHQLGFRGMGDEELVRHLRSRALARLTSLRTPEAIAEVEVLARREPRLRYRLLDMIDAHRHDVWKPLTCHQVFALLRGLPLRGVYLSSRFSAPVRNALRKALEVFTQVITTDPKASSSPPREEIGRDIRRAQILVQVVSWSTGVGEPTLGGTWLGEEIIFARALGRSTLVGVLEDADECPPVLKEYLARLEGVVQFSHSGDADLLVRELTEKSRLLLSSHR